VLGVILVGDLYEQPYCFISQGDVCGVEALHQCELPALQTVFVQFDQLVQTADAEVLHIVVAVVEELVNDLAALFGEVVVGVDVADGLDGLLQDALAEVHGWVGSNVLEERFVQYRSYFSST
jgi:hypothetical protein